MDNLTILRKMAPEALELIERRHTVLRNIYFAQPIGRRALASRIQWPERMVRKEIDFLRNVDLISSDPSGMRVSGSGEKVLEAVLDIIRDMHGLSGLENTLAERLNLKKAIVVPGDSDEDETVKKELARVTAEYLHEVLHQGSVLAVTGGSTLAEVARSLPESDRVEDVVVVPARGGLGEDVELQANSVAAHIAQRLGAKYRLLHVPDDLGDEAVLTIANEPKIRALLDLIKSADIVLHGIGSAEEMAKRRGLSRDHLSVLEKRMAVGEAFGYYFNARGQAVFSTSSVGLRLDDLDQVGLVVAVGGGHSKAEAALAVMSTHHQDVFITDEGAARRILKIGDSFRDEF